MKLQKPLTQILAAKLVIASAIFTTLDIKDFSQILNGMTNA